MNVQVTVPSMSIPGEIGRRLLRLGTIVESEELSATLTRVVAEAFVRRYSDHSAVLEGLNEYRQFVIEVQDDIADRRPKHLASFNLLRSRQSDAVHFSVSSHLVYSDLLPHYGLMDPEAWPPEEYWSHELIHLLDWKMLSAFRADFEQAKKGNHVSSLFGLDFERRAVALPREWEVLLVLASFRDEGLANLYPYLTGESKLAMLPQDARERFRELFALIMRYARRPILAWSNDKPPYPKEYIDLRNALHSLSYVAGPYFAIDAIRASLQQQERRDNDLLALVDATVKRMSQGQPAGMTREDAARLIRIALHLNLSAFLALSIDKLSAHPWDPFLDLNAISELYNFISYHGTEPCDGFMDRLCKSILYDDRTGYLEALHAVVGYSMERTEIESEHRRWRETKAQAIDNSLMLNEIHVRLDHLEQRYRSEASVEDHDLIALALTYVFDPEDYIKDQMVVFGHLDDLYVLRAACELLGMKAD